MTYKIGLNRGFWLVAPFILTREIKPTYRGSGAILNDSVGPQGVAGSGSSREGDRSVASPRIKFATGSDTGRSRASQVKRLKAAIEDAIGVSTRIPKLA